MFRDRTDAGRKLAAELTGLVQPPAVVAAIPRGGVAVALPIVECLRLPLAVVYARKITSRMAPELALGAVDEDGEALVDPRTLALLGIDHDALDRAKTRVAGDVRRLMDLYGVPPLSHYLPGASIVLVDDGLATGLTMRAAVAYARRHGARDVIVAVPCASGEAAARFRAEADRFVSLVVDPDFYAVGAYYMDFASVSDEEVLAMLAEAQKLIEERVAAMRLLFKNSRGLALSAELLLPDTAGPHPVVVLAQGDDSGRASPRRRAMGERLVAAGLAACLLDFTGHGESEGAPVDCTAEQRVDDLRAAVAVLGTLDDIDTERVGVLAERSGAAAALRCAAAVPTIRALALWSAHAEGAEDAASRVDVPTLLVVGERDVPALDTNQRLVRTFAGPVRLEIVPAGHDLFEEAGGFAHAAALTTAWFSRHLATVRELCGANAGG